MNFCCQLIKKIKFLLIEIGINLFDKSNKNPKKIGRMMRLSTIEEFLNYAYYFISITTSDELIISSLCVAIITVEFS